MKVWIAWYHYVAYGDSTSGIIGLFNRQEDAISAIKKYCEGDKMCFESDCELADLEVK